MPYEEPYFDTDDVPDGLTEEEERKLEEQNMI